MNNNLQKKCAAIVEKLTLIDKLNRENKQIEGNIPDSSIADEKDHEDFNDFDNLSFNCLIKKAISGPIHEVKKENEDSFN